MSISSQLVADFKLYRQISGTDAARDLRIGVIVDGILAMAERYLNRVFTSAATTTETHDFNVNGVYYLKQVPITVMTGVTYVGFDGSTQALASSQYKLNTDTGEIHVAMDQILPTSLWMLGMDDINNAHESFQVMRFSYTGGYTTIPNDMKHAFLKMIDDDYSSNAYGQGVNHQLDGNKLGDMSFTWKSEEDQRKLLERYLLPFKTGGVL